MITSLAINIEKLFTVVVYFSDVKNKIELIKLTKNLVDQENTLPLNKHLRKLYIYFREYFNNTNKNEDIYEYIDLDDYSEFYKALYDETKKIPYGTTTTYSALACLLGKSKAARAVGNCLAKNRYPLIIPCHRVVSKMNLGGFKYGCELKKMIIEREKVYQISCI